MASGIIIAVTRLPTTYIDILKQRAPTLFEIAAEDLNSLTSNAEPFGSCADLPHAYEYVGSVEARIRADMRRQLPGILKKRSGM